MTYVIGAVAVIGAVCLLNLLLTYGVIRRLREHTELLPARPGAGRQPPLGLPAGAEVGEFTASDRDGVPIGRSDLAGSWLVGFFSPKCPTCTEQLPGFVDVAGAAAGGRERVVAVVIGGAAAAADQVERLWPVARVVVDDPGPLVEAFGVQGYPAFFVVDDGVVRAVGYKAAALPAGVPA